MLLEEPAHLGKHDAEQSPFEVSAKKQRWEHSQRGEDLESKELLAWELEQEQWTEKSDAAILEDPSWQRVGIKAVSSSDDERQQMTSGRLSPDIKALSPSFPESPRPTMSPARSFSQAGPEPFFLEDQRLVQRPPSPTISVHSAHQLGTILSPSSTRPPSPSPSVRSASAYGRYHSQDPNYVFYPSTPTGSRTIPNWSIEPNSPYTEPTNDHFRLEQQLTMRMKPFSPPTTVQSSTSMSGRAPYMGMNRGDLSSIDASFPVDVSAKSPIASAYHQTVPIATSRNSHQGTMSRNDEADQLEAEYARLESGRARNFGFPGIDERDEHDAMRSPQGTKMGYDLDELEQEYERLEMRNNEIVNVEEAPEVLEALEASDDDGVIHLEDQVSLGEEEPEGSKIDQRGYGIKELEAEFDEAVRRKEALMRNCSMDSNEGDDILGDPVMEAPKEEPSRRRIPVRKSRWQEKLERFERRGLDAAESKSDVSKYPRLQQIRQRRRERLRALMSIRQERAEIWNTLEANWEQMENSMTRRLGTETKSRGPDPVPATPEEDDHTELDTTNDDPSKDTDVINDSLRLSESEPSNSSKEPDTNSEILDGVEEGKDTCKDGGGVQMVEPSATDKESTIKQDGVESPSRGDSVATASVLEKVSSPGKPDSHVVPAPSFSLLESIACASAGKQQEALTATSDQGCKADGGLGNTAQKEDPPPSFGTYVSQSMSDVGSKVVKILKAARSSDEHQHQQRQQPGIISQGTDTVEEEASQLAEEARDDDETSNGLGLDMAAFEEDEEDEPEHQGCVNPLRSLVGKQRRIVVEDVTGPGCINPLVAFGFEKVTRMCAPNKVPAKVRNEPRTIHGRIQPLSNAYSDTQEDGNHQGYVRHNRSEDERKYLGTLGGSHSHSDDRDAPGFVTPLKSTTSVASRKSRRSKKSKHKKKTGGGAGGEREREQGGERERGERGGVDKFFTLVDDLLVNNILNIMDEKAVDKMAHTFGFD